MNVPFSQPNLANYIQEGSDAVVSQITFPDGSTQSQAATPSSKVTGIGYEGTTLTLTQSSGIADLTTTIPSSSTLPFEYIQSTAQSEITGTGTYPGADITLLTKSITPTSASQKVLVQLKVNGCWATSAFRGSLTIRRSVSGQSDVYLAPPPSGNITSCTGAFANSHQTTTARIDQTSVLFIDEPGTTSAVTYTPSVFNSQSNFSFFFNRSKQEANVDDDYRTPSTMTLRCFE